MSNGWARVAKVMGIFILTTATILFGQNATGKLYVNVAEENLRSAPSGKKIGAVLQGTETTVLVEQEKWVKVQVTGWLWKGSLTATQPTSIEGQMHALHILVKTREDAEQVLQLIKSGKDFQEVAKTKSILPNAAKGGDLGYFNKGDFDPKIEAAIEALKVNEVSGIVETKFGFNIFKRLK